MKNGKNTKINLRSIPRHENLVNLFLLLPGQLQMRPKAGNKFMV